MPGLNSDYSSLIIEDKSQGAFPALSSYISTIFEDYKNARKPFEDIWEEIWYNFLGQYNPKTTTRHKEGEISRQSGSQRSRIFIKVTQLKCHTAHAKISKSFQQGIPFGFIPIGELEDTQLDAAREIIEKRVKVIKNYFHKHKINKVFDDAILSLAIFGTAILKAPVVKQVKDISIVSESEGNIPIETATNPFSIKYQYKNIITVEEVPIWEFFFDPHSKDTESSIGVIQFKRLLPAQFRQFTMRPDFNKEAVEESIRRANVDPGDDVDKTRIQLGDNYMGKSGEKDKKVSCLDWWGLTPVGMMREYFEQFPNDFSKKYLEELKDKDDSQYIESNVILGANGIVCKAALNLMGKRPYHVCQYKTRPNSIVGTGVAELMRDSQKMINSAMRMVIDNKAMSGNGMLGINHNSIDWARTKRPEMYPRKIWYTKGSINPTEAIKEIKVSDVTAGLLELMGVFLRFADEETALPKFTSGEQDAFLNKMLDINTEVPMADGKYKLLKDIKDGDVIVGSKGNPTKVIKAHKIHHPKKAYEIEFSSGEKILAGGEHLWTIQTGKMKTLGSRKTVDTDTIFKMLKKTKVNIYVPRVFRPRTGKHIKLPINPYIFGVWLGDGHTHSPRVTTSDSYIVERLSEFAEKYGGVKKDKFQNGGKATSYYVRGLFQKLKPLGFIRGKKSVEKHIPKIFFMASYEQRLELLRGLMDTDGCHHSGALSIFTQKESVLLDHVIMLINSLGGYAKKCKTNPGKLAVKNTNYYNVNFNLFDNPFNLPSKAIKWQSPQKKYDNRIMSVKEKPVCLMRCLTVDAKDGLFCVGRKFTVTHNTATGISILLQQANINMRTVHINIDDNWIEPITDMFDKVFQVEGKYPEGINIPLKVKSLGLENLMAEEIKLDNLMRFMQITAAPQDAMFVDRIAVMREISRILDVSEFVKSKEEAELIMQQISRMAQGQAGGDQSRHRMLALSKMFSSLSANEQDQALKNDFDINPDPNRVNQKRMSPEENVAALDAATELAGGGPGV
jgi:intein/homing endonuclease